MKRIPPVFGLSWLVAGVVLAAPTDSGTPEKKLPPAKPEAYPTVELTAGSQPRYAAVAVDAWQGKVAYLLFDGTAKAGYSRLYAWIPEDRKYGNPVELKPNTDNKFAVFGLVDALDEEKSDVSWQMSQELLSRGAGTHTRTDYVTGKTITTSSKAWSGYRLRFSVNFAYGPRMASTSRAGGAKLPMDVVIGAELGTAETWEKVPATGGFAPWERLHVQMSRQREHGRDSGRIHFQCSDVRYANTKCVVKSLPGKPEVILKVMPYLESAVYSNTVALTTLMKDGVDVDLPYGWYTFACTPFKCGKFSYGVSMPDIRAWPHAFSKPAPAN